MPLYEYRCPRCGQRFEKLRKMQDSDRDVVCPSCQSLGAERLLSTFASRVSGGDLGPCGQPASACGGGSGGFS